MHYIDKENKQIIIDTSVSYTITRQTTKDGKEKENIKYIASIPNEVLIFLLEKFSIYDESIYGSTAEYIDAMLNSNEKYYLSFVDAPGNDVILSCSNYKLAFDDGVSVTIKKQSNSSTRFFTVSKKIFNELKNNKKINYKLRFVIDLFSDSECLKNSIVYVSLF